MSSGQFIAPAPFYTPTNERRAALIAERLQRALAPTHIEIIDDSARHANHVGARESGGAHFRLRITATAFAGKTTLQRHRLVYGELADLIPYEIHALSIEAEAP